MLHCFLEYVVNDISKFRSWRWGTTILRNVGNYLPNDTVPEDFDVQQQRCEKLQVPLKLLFLNFHELGPVFYFDLELTPKFFKWFTHTKHNTTQKHYTPASIQVLEVSET